MSGKSELFQGLNAMSRMTRRRAMTMVGASGAAMLAASASAQAHTQGSKVNSEPVVDSTAKATNTGPRFIFAVVDRDGRLHRGLHAVAAKRLDVGVYEVTFDR